MYTSPKLDNLCALMDAGEPVCVTFLGEETGEVSEELFCELVSAARYGRESRITAQRCRVGAYVLGKSETSPADYYLKSGRYAGKRASETAVSGLSRIEKEYGSVRISPLSLTKEPFDICILYLRPEAVMRIIQTLGFREGTKTGIDTLGIASICGDCTAKPLRAGAGFSFGCKGSRKHSGYPDTEVPVGLRHDLLDEINRNLGILPGTRQ